MIQASLTSANDVFGGSVSMSADGQYAIVGATGNDTGGADAGAAYIFKTDNYIPTRTTGVSIDSTVNTTKTMAVTDNVLIKTGNTSNVEYIVTLPKNMVDGRIVTIFTTVANTTGISFFPVVVGRANPTPTLVNTSVRLLYSAITNNWYSI
jgi:hypothetical protein